MSKHKTYTNRELAEAHFIPAVLTPAEKKQADKDFSTFRKAQLASLSPEELLYSQLMQVKYIMEDYINSSSYNESYTFGYFLNEYIHILHKGKTDFSKEISVHHTKLSRLLNNRDEPNEKILVRLEIHSHNTIPADTWYKIREKQKIYALLNAKKLRDTERRHVKVTAQI